MPERRPPPFANATGPPSRYRVVAGTWRSSPGSGLPARLPSRTAASGIVSRQLTPVTVAGPHRLRTGFRGPHALTNCTIANLSSAAPTGKGIAQRSHQLGAARIQKRQQRGIRVGTLAQGVDSSHSSS